MPGTLAVWTLTGGWMVGPGDVVFLPRRQAHTWRTFGPEAVHLHVTVAPVLLGSGIPAFTLPEAARIADGLRFEWEVHRLGRDVLFDIALHRARPGVCC